MSNKPAPAPVAAPKWGDAFENPDNVGQSEYRALVELLADANEIDNVAGEVDPDTEITREQRDHMLCMLDESIDHAKAMKKRLRGLKFPR